MAGRRPETDEHLATAVKAMMAAQRQEGSWEGDPVYQGFNTPFRATQFAVMALSTLYPGTTEAKNWDAGFPAPPTKLAKNNLPLLLSQLDQYWDLAPEPVLKQIREVLVKSDQPLAREAAARALGHMADPGSLPALMTALGDQTKMVQSSAAYAVRMILSRRQDAAPEGRKLLIAALASSNPRQRWGAARVFNQHFRDLTGDPALLAALEKAVDDPVPFVRFEAASGLWRWYYWQIDKPDMRRSTLETLATRMNVETDAMVRRGLQESIYDLLDENTGYLTAWVRASAEDEDKKRIGDGYESVVHDQAQVLAKVLKAGTPLGREGILERPMGLPHPPLRPAPNQRKHRIDRPAGGADKVRQRSAGPSSSWLRVPALSRSRRLQIRRAQRLLPNKNRQRQRPDSLLQVERPGTGGSPPGLLEGRERHHEDRSPESRQHPQRSRRRALHPGRA